jgi:Calcineurin-like phosphoesterase
LNRPIEKGDNIVDEELEFPQFPSDDVPVERIIQLQTERFKARMASHAAHTWYKVKVKSNEPIAIVWFGDPHVDDNGCDWPTLMKDIELVSSTPGVYGANLGDTTNNWFGRLAHLYSNQDTSKKTAQKLAKWFLSEAGIPWLIVLLGNHDMWADGSVLLSNLVKGGAAKIMMHEWEARFQLEFPNGHKVRIHAAHDFPGNSQWNPLHGPMKQAMWGEEAHLLACGDKHNWSIFRWENARRGLTQTVIRARGYKFMDDYARNLGLPEQRRGCSITTVIDPSKPPGEGIAAFDDVATAIAFLKSLRRG